jgi:4-amino-4-deoxy-L-arabinose transferase-like glycosyltransferase
MLAFLLQHKQAFVILIAVIVRVAFLLIFPDIFAYDQTGAIHGSDAYDAYAQNLLATGVYGRTAGVPDAAIPPLYSYALAAVYGLFGRGYLQTGIFHILLDVFCISAIFAVGKRLFKHGEWVGTIAGICYALYPYLVFQNLTLIDTPFFMAMLYAFIWVVMLLRERDALDRTTWLLSILGGVLLGLSMLTRPILPFLAVFVALWFLFRLSLWQSILRLLPVALVGALVLMPWIIRNYTIFDAFVPMTTTSGANLWQGNNPMTIPVFRAGYDVQWLSPDPALIQSEDPKSREADAERFALSMAYLRENPQDIPELLWVKFLVQWSIDIAPRYNPVEGQLPRIDYDGDVYINPGENEDEYFMDGLPQGDPVALYSTSLFDQVGRIVHQIYWGGLLILGLIGVVLTVKQWRNVSLIWFIQISMTIVYIIFHPSTRYRVPTDPFVFLFSAHTLIYIGLWLQQRIKTRSA